MINTLGHDRTEYIWDETRDAVIGSTANDCYYLLLGTFGTMESGVLGVFIELAFDLDETFHAND